MFGQNDEPLLSDEETSALLDAMREEEKSAESEVAKTDLGSPEGPMREALGRADAALTAIGGAARTQLLVQTARGIEMELLPCEVVPRDVFVGALDQNAVVYDVVHKNDSMGLLSVDSSLGRYILERSMGALEEEPPGAAAKEFSDIDRTILEPFPRAVMRALSASFLSGRALTLALHDEGVTAKGAARFEPLMRLAIRFSTGAHRVGEVLIALNAAAVAASSPTTEAQKAKNQRPRDARAQMERSVTSATVELIAVLGRAPSSVGQLLELAAGDVLRLDTGPHETVSMCVGDVELARGVPVVVSGNLAIELCDANAAPAAQAPQQA
ncbi:MAG: FliM/FliN family flagellar motor switch protein [Sandaracinaceae bacterium]